MFEIHWWKTDRIWAEAARCPLQLCLSVCLDLFILKTHWDFTLQNSFDANSLIEGTLHFVDSIALHGIWPSSYWMDFPGGCVGNYFSTTISQSWSEISCRTWTPRYFSGLDHCNDCVFLDSKQHKAFSSQCVHTAWSDRSEPGFPHKCMCPLF